MTVQLRHCVRAAQRGDTLAMEEVIREFDPFLCKLAKAYQEEYQDYYQTFGEALSTAYQGALQCIFKYDLDQPESVTKVMVASVYNQFRRETYQHTCYHKKIKKNIFDKDTVTDLPENALASERYCPEHKYLQTEISLELDQTLEILPELHREMIVKHVIDGDSYSQLAKEHCLSKAGVGYQVKQGLSKLSRHMTEEGTAG